MIPHPRSLGVLLALAGCAPAPDASSDETDADGPSPSGPAADTAIDWSRAPGQGGSSGEDEDLTDPAIGSTALDGRWVGTFTLTEVVPFGLGNAVCAGEGSLVVDGQATRHVVVELACDGWDPQIAVGPKYGALTGVGFATLDPAALTPFRVDLGLGARNMQTVNAEGAVARLDGEVLTVRYDDVFGIGTLKSGHRLVLEVRREVP